MLSRYQTWRRIKTVRDSPADMKDYSDVSNKKGRSVAFNPVVKVVLIPSGTDYRENNMSEFIWYSASELHSMKLSASLEIRAFMSIFPNISSRMAMKLIYQSASVNDSSGMLKENICPVKKLKYNRKKKYNSIEILYQASGRDSLKFVKKQMKRESSCNDKMIDITRMGICQSEKVVDQMNNPLSSLEQFSSFVHM